MFHIVLCIFVDTNEINHMMLQYTIRLHILVMNVSIHNYFDLLVHSHLTFCCIQQINIRKINVAE